MISSNNNISIKRETCSAHDKSNRPTQESSALPGHHPGAFSIDLPEKRRGEECWKFAYFLRNWLKLCTGKQKTSDTFSPHILLPFSFQRDVHKKMKNKGTKQQRAQMNIPPCIRNLS